MKSPNPFEKTPFATKGDQKAETLYAEVGEALSKWEHAEASFAHLFGTIINPTKNSFAARRAYGSVASARGRADLLEAVAEVFFRNFPNEETQENMRTLMSHYGKAGGRRNELAHGIVGGDKDDDGKFLGYFIVPSVWNKRKRGLDMSLKYRYSTKEIKELHRKFSVLGGQAVEVADEISEIFQSSPRKLRLRW